MTSAEPPAIRSAAPEPVNSPPPASVPILVAGMGRCGSSLVMQMLQAAGVPCLGEYPAFEPEEVNAATRRPHLLMACLNGRAAKILDPHRDSDWPNPLEARVIWLERDLREQAKSQVKFLRLVAGLELPGQTWRAMRSGLELDGKLCERWLDRCVPTPTVLHFEEVLRRPITAAVEIASFLGLPPGVERVMAAQVIQRGPECQPAVDIEMRLCRQAKHSDLWDPNGDEERDWAGCGEGEE